MQIEEILLKLMADRANALKIKDYSQASMLQSRAKVVEALFVQTALGELSEDDVYLALGIERPNLFNQPLLESKNRGLNEAIETLLLGGLKNMPEVFVAVKKDYFGKERVTKPELLIFIVENSNSNKMASFASLIAKKTKESPLEAFLMTKAYLSRSFDDKESVVAVRSILENQFLENREGSVPQYYIDKFKYRDLVNVEEETKYRHETGGAGYAGGTVSEFSLHKEFESNFIRNHIKSIYGDGQKPFTDKDISAKAQEIAKLLDPKNYHIIKNMVKEV